LYLYVIEDNKPGVDLLSSLNSLKLTSSAGIYNDQLQLQQEEDQQDSPSVETATDHKKENKEDPEWCVVQLDEMKATTFDSRLREEKVTTNRLG